MSRSRERAILVCRGGASTQILYSFDEQLGGHDGTDACTTANRKPSLDEGIFLIASVGLLAFEIPAQ